MTLPARESNAPRVLVLDFIRLVAMLLMIQGHTLAALVDPARMNLDSFHWQAYESLRGLTAPMFLMVSGAATVLGIRFGADGRPAPGMLRRRIRVAFMVAGIGYLLVFPAHRIADLRWVSRDVWRGFLQVGILQLNGLILLLLTALLWRVRTVRRYAAFSLAAGALILAAAPLVAAVDWFRWLPEGVAAYLSFDHGSLFPVFPYGGYMFLGVGLGALLLETPEPRRGRAFRLACLIAGGGLLLFALTAEHLPWRLISLENAYKGGYAYTTFRFGSTLLLFGLLAWVAERCPRLVAAWAPVGRKSLFVYVGHLVLLYGSPWTPGLITGRFHALDLGQGALGVLLVAGITLGAVLLRDWIRNRSRPLGTLLHASVLLALACAMIW